MVSLLADSELREDAVDTTQTVQDAPPEPVIALRAEPRDPGDAEHFVVCMECGQGFDRRNLAHALYHAEPDHDPFFVES